MTLLYSLLHPVKTVKKLGIYMELSSANLIEFTINLLKMKALPSNFIFYEESQILQQGQTHLENNEKQLCTEYLKRLSDYILLYDEVIIFGTRKAATLLFKHLSHDNRFYKIKIALKATTKMTPEEQNNFVTNYFLLDKL